MKFFENFLKRNGIDARKVFATVTEVLIESGKIWKIKISVEVALFLVYHILMNHEISDQNEKENVRVIIPEIEPAAGDEILPAYEGQKKPGEIILPEEKTGAEKPAPEIVLASEKELSEFSKQTETEKENWEKFFGMTEASIVYKMSRQPTELLDIFAKKCGIASYDDISKAAEKLNFKTTEFVYENKKKLEETRHLFSELLRDYGDICPEEFYVFLFFTAKLGRYGEKKEELAVSDEFINTVLQSLSKFSYSSEKFSFIYDTADMLADCFSKEAAKGIISTLKKKHLLSGSLAQTLFYRYPELRDGGAALDLREIPLSDILENREEFEMRAMNEEVTLREIGTNVGMEMEVKLAGRKQERGEKSPLRRKVEGNGDFWDLGVDGLGEIAELRNLGGGVPLNEKTAETLRFTVRSLEQSADVAAFGTTHINVDRKALNEATSLLNFRKFEPKRMEISEVPLSSQNNGLSFDASGYIDQMMIVAAFSDVSIFEAKKRLAFLNRLTDEEKISLASGRQNMLARTYIELAAASGKQEYLPAILRASRKRILPALRVEKLVSGISFDSVKNLLSDEQVDWDTCNALARGIANVSFEQIEPFIKNKDTDPFILNILIERMEEVSFETVSDFLQEKDGNYKKNRVRSVIAEKIAEVPFEKVEELLKDENIDSQIRLRVAKRIAPVPFEKVEGFLRDKDARMHSPMRSIVARHIEKIPFERAEAFINDHDIYPDVREAVAGRIAEIPFEKIRPLLILKGNKPDDNFVCLALARNIAEVPFEKVEEFLKIGGVNPYIRAAVARRIEEIPLKKVENFLESEFIHPAVREALAERIAEIPFGKEVEWFLRGKETDYRVLRAVAERIAEIPFEQIESFLRNEEVEYIVRMNAAHRIAKTPFEKVEGFLRDNSVDPAVRLSVAGVVASQRQQREEKEALAQTK